MLLQKKIAEGTATEKTHTNLQKSRENLSMVIARKEELDTKLANAERNLAKANKHIETLLAKSTLTAARGTQNVHYVFFSQACMQQKDKTLQYPLGFTKRF